MQISYNWLKTYLPELELNPDETAKVLTDIGLEVEAVEEFESVKGGLQGLVIGHVLEKEKHPDADRLSVTKVQVDATGTIHQIVCGAPNVDKGQKVVVALPGTTVYPTEGESFKIKLSKIRGVESAGMICAEDEIGLGKSHEGIMILPAEAPIGAAAAAYFNVSSDYVIHIGLTPNRIDAASHYGVARDLKAALHAREGKVLTLKKPEVKVSSKTTSSGYTVNIENKEGCKTYFGLEISNVKVADSPDWLKQKLAAIGVRSINNIVDITNFVMHECGQPLHAFDAAKITGKKIVIRAAKDGELFTTLDGVERKLSGNDLIIADAEKPMCLAGIFGGLHSGVSTETTSVILESAWFNPVWVRKSARRNELHTDSSFRFERGADPEMTGYALMRAAGLMEEIAGGKIADGYMLDGGEGFVPAEIELDLKKLDAFTGEHIAPEKVETILKDLDFVIVTKKENTWTLKAPMYRVDVLRAVDVYEEILRIYGYNAIHIPAKINATPQLTQGVDHEKLVENVSQFLTDKGFAEIMNNSLNSLDVNKLGGSEDTSVKLLNPLSSELDVLRNNLVYGGLQAVAYNLHRQLNNLKFFELGSVYHKQGDKFTEDQQLGIWLTGSKNTGNWTDAKDDVTYYTLKGIVETLVRKFTKTALQSSYGSEHGFLYDTYEVKLNNKNLVIAGAVRNEALIKYDIKQPVYYACIDLNVLTEAVKRSKFKYQEVSKYPFIKRDLALLVDAGVEFGAIENAVVQADKQLIKSVEIFDVYTGKNLEPGKRSYAISLTIQDQARTLKDEEVEKLMEKVLKNIADKTGAVLR